MTNIYNDLNMKLVKVSVSPQLVQGNE